MLQLLALPFLACLVLTAIHGYFGVHIIERGDVFLALSLAQIAGLGTMVALFAGFDVHSRTSFFWSLAFTILGAAIFALMRAHRETRIPQEAILGVVYAVSAAGAIVAMSKVPAGTEHLKDMLVGNILTVSVRTVIKTAVLCAFVGLFHYIFRKRFLANRRLPDFLFYALFGLAVTSSVPIAGVLLVFSYLIVPSVAAMLFSRSTGKRLAIAWPIGALVSMVGMIVSFKADLPTGAAIVCTFGIALAIMAIAGRWHAARLAHPQHARTPS